MSLRIINAPHAVEKEDSTFLHSLSYVFGHAEPSAALFRAARGDPYRLVQALVQRAASASVAASRAAAWSVAVYPHKKQNKRTTL